MRRQKWPNGYPGLQVSDRSDTSPEPPPAAPEAPLPAPVVDLCGFCGHAKEKHFHGRGGCSGKAGDFDGSGNPFCGCSRFKSPARKVSDRSDTSAPALPGAEEWLKGSKKKARKKSPNATPLQLKSAETGFEEIRRAKEWHLMEPRHFLGLYIVCHRKIYGTEPSDLYAQWAGAISAVRSMLAKEFSDDPSKMVAFCTWAWSREEAREKQRRSNGGDFRLAWRFLFVRQAAAGMLTDWRTSLARASKTRENVKAAQ